MSVLNHHGEASTSWTHVSIHKARRGATDSCVCWTVMFLGASGPGVCVPVHKSTSTYFLVHRGSSRFRRHQLPSQQVGPQASGVVRSQHLVSVVMVTIVVETGRVSVVQDIVDDHGVLLRHCHPAGETMTEEHRCCSHPETTACVSEKDSMNVRMRMNFHSRCKLWISLPA